MFPLGDPIFAGEKVQRHSSSTMDEPPPPGSGQSNSVSFVVPAPTSAAQIPPTQTRAIVCLRILLERCVPFSFLPNSPPFANEQLTFSFDCRS